MRDFLDRAAVLGSTSRRQGDDEAFDRVLRARSELQLVHSKARFDLRNLESVFAAFEMAELFGRLGALAGSDVEALTRSMRRVIVRTLELTMEFQVAQGAIQPSNDYHRLARTLFEMVNRGERVCVITFNYDVALDFALGVHFQTVDYGFLPEPMMESSIELLKLHGSLNWGICSNEKCGGIGSLDVAAMVDTFEREGRVQADHGQAVRLEMSDRLSANEHLNCRANYQIEPVVVPPTTSKVGYHKQLEPVWRRAAKRLADADSIYVIGYSWPYGDQFFHQLFAIGSIGPQLLKRFAVINIDPAVRDRFKSELLGQQAVDRFEENTEHLVGFGRASINQIRGAYGLADLDYLRPRTRQSQ